jgi:hypothetical protein
VLLRSDLVQLALIFDSCGSSSTLAGWLQKLNFASSVALAFSTGLVKKERVERFPGQARVSDWLAFAWIRIVLTWTYLLVIF